MKLFASLFQTLKNKKIIIVYRHGKIRNKGRMLVNKKILVGKRWNHIDDGFASLVIKRNGKFKVDDFVIYSGCRVTIKENANLSIKSGYMNFNSVINCAEKISIGSDVAIANGVIIRDNDGHTIGEKASVKPITIGNHVWIGTNAIILKGCNIGNNVVIGAGSVVTKNIPSNCIVAGNPAKVIRENVNWR